MAADLHWESADLHWESVDEGLYVGISKLFGEAIADYLASTGTGKRPIAREEDDGR